MAPDDRPVPQGSSNSVFEFSGDAAASGADGPSFSAAEGSGSFVGGSFDLGADESPQHSNLSGGGGKWIAIVAVLLIVGGGAAWAMIGGGAAAADREARLVGERGLPEDFPVPAAFTEGRYLKIKLLRLS